MKVAIVTGGSSGMGLSVVQALSTRSEEWHMHIIDRNVLSHPPARTTMHQVDIAEYTALAQVFHDIFTHEGRLDFVYANAGISGPYDFCVPVRDSSSSPPPEPNHGVVEVNLKATINTCYLAWHYFLQTKADMAPATTNMDFSLVVTSSCAALYPMYAIPLYTAAKAGLLGFVYAVARPYVKHGIRVNAVLPGAVATNIGGPGGFDQFPPHVMVPVENIAKAVLIFVDGKTAKDSSGVEVDGKDLYGKAIEASGKELYFRQELSPTDDVSRDLMTFLNGIDLATLQTSA